MGIYIVAFGTHCITYCWNEISDDKDRAKDAADLQDKRVATLRAVAAEMDNNRHALSHESYVSGENPAYYPKSDTNALGNAMTSGLFIQNEDRAVFTHLYLVRHNLEEINHLISMGTEGALQLSNRSKSIRSEILRTRQIALNQMLALDILLQQKFKIDPAEEFFIK
jgi:hypothetical protein